MRNASAILMDSKERILALSLSRLPKSEQARNTRIADSKRFHGKVGASAVSVCSYYRKPNSPISASLIAQHRVWEYKCWSGGFSVSRTSKPSESSEQCFSKSGSEYFEIQHQHFLSWIWLVFLVPLAETRPEATTRINEHEVLWNVTFALAVSCTFAANDITKWKSEQKIKFCHGNDPNYAPSCWKLQAFYLSRYYRSRKSLAICFQCLKFIGFSQRT